MPRTTMTPTTHDLEAGHGTYPNGDQCDGPTTRPPWYQLPLVQCGSREVTAAPVAPPPIHASDIARRQHWLVCGGSEAE